MTGLVEPAPLREFLKECGDTLTAGGTRSATAVVDDVAAGHGVARRVYLRLAKQPVGVVTPARLSTTITTDSLFRFFIGDDYRTSALPVVLPRRPFDSAAGPEEYRELLAAMVADASWFRPDAMMGRPLPEPRNCWLTTDEFGPDPDPMSYLDEGTAARDALGLIDCKDGSFLVRMSFPAGDLETLDLLELARPVCCDMGNSRFRVSQSSSRAKSFAAGGWGATVHLGKLAAGRADATGVGERVASAIPLAHLTALRVELIGRVTVTSAEGHVADEHFATWLEDGQTSLAIRHAVLARLE